jgi:tetratricopeptide (TPR) repeat protein
VLPGFSLTHENAPAVIQICRQLDGIPLALELAAIQLKTMPVGEVARRLEDRFLLLTNGHRTALVHHRTLRGVLDWSYDFLSEEERSLFRQLSLFSGGWTLGSAGQVAAGFTLELLTALVNKSLVIVEASEQERRYRMLETIRQYGREKLAESGHEEALHNRHLGFFLQFAERSRTELRGGDQRLWMDQVQAEHDNIRMALEWALRSAEQSEAGLRLAVAMSEFWGRCNYYREGRQWLERGLALTAEACPPRLCAWAQLKLSYFAFFLGDFETLGSSLDFAWEVLRNLEDIEGMAFVMQGRGALAGEHKHDLATARSCFEESLRLLESIGDKWEMAETLRDLGHVHYLQGDLGEARSCFNENLRLCRATSNTVQHGKTLYHLGLVAYQEGDYPSARSFFEESRQLVKEHGNRDCDLEALGGLAELARCEKNYPQAQTFYEEGLLLARELAEEEAVADFLRGLGYVALHFGEYQRATELFNESLQYWQKQNMRLPGAGCVLGLAGVAAALGEMEKSARLLGEVDALLKETGAYRSPANRMDYEHTVSTTRAHLGEEQFRAVWQEGYDSGQIHE